jgi:hypothetical protein
LVGDIKHIVIIESLVDERLTGLEMYNDCIRRRIDFQQKPFTHKYHPVHSKIELVELLKYYQINASYLNGGLLFHFEMHGAENLTGLVLSNNELISWKEMVDLFRPINIVLCDGLFVTMATCYGRHLYKGVDPYQKSPYSGYISASKAIYPSEIVDEYSLLFEELIENGNLVKAFLEMQKTKSSFYYKDSKRTFEESYKFIFDSLNNNAEYKAKFIAESRNQAEQMGQPIPDAEVSEFLFQTAMKDIYAKQKQAFDFKDCE